MVAQTACADPWCSLESSGSKTLANHGQASCTQMHLAICIYRWKRPRMRRRRLHMYLTDHKRPRRDLRTTNRQDSAGAAAVVASSISRIKKNIFFGPQEVSHCSLWTRSEPKDTQESAWPVCSLHASVLRGANNKNDIRAGRLGHQCVAADGCWPLSKPSVVPQGAHALRQRRNLRSVGLKRE